MTIRYYDYKNIEWTTITVNKREFGMVHWCQYNCIEDFSYSYNNFFFENAKDAALFALRWA